MFQCHATQAASEPSDEQPPADEPPTVHEELAAAALGSGLRIRALRLTHSRADADDLVQQTFERALSSLRFYRRGSNMMGWLHTIMLNLHLDEKRRVTRHRSLDRRLRDLEEVSNVTPGDPEDDRSPCEVEITAEQLAAAIASLEPRLRAVAQLRLVEKRSYGEIATHLGIPGATVGTRLHRCRARLRLLLLDQGAPDGRLAPVALCRTVLSEV